MTNIRARSLAALDTLTILVTACWFGGLVILGAIVAPTVFHNVPSPFAADAMTLAFQRFDQVATLAGGVALVLEIARSVATGSGGPLPISRIAVLCAALGLAGIERWSLSPAIQALHRLGATRGVGEGGMQLDHLHHWAERGAKAELAFLVVYIALFAVRTSAPSASRTP